MSSLDRLGDFLGIGFVGACFMHFLAPRYSPVLWLRGCQEYNGTPFCDDKKIAETVKKVHERIEYFRKKMGIESPVSLMLTSNYFMGKAQGIAGIPGWTSPVIATGALELTNLKDDDDRDYVICHELAHIKNGDTLKFASFLATVAAVMAITGSIFAALAGLGVLVFLSKHLEKQADLEAVKSLGSAAKTISLFERVQKHHLLLREKGTWIEKLCITPDGDLRWDILHPTWKERIDYLKLSNPV